MTASETLGVDRSLRIRQTITIVVIAALLFIAWRNQVARNQAEVAEAVAAKEAASKAKLPKTSESNDDPTERSSPKIESIEKEVVAEKAPSEKSTAPLVKPPEKTKTSPDTEKKGEVSTKTSASNDASSAKSSPNVATPAKSSNGSTKTPSAPKSMEEVKVAAKPQTTPPPEKKETSDKPKVRTKIDNQTIRNEDGEVVFKGTVDLAATIDRVLDEKIIERFRHDGITFQNRERKLPNKPPGYYREWVHPTPGLGGPGPQRIISGEGGELFYTPNHYISFIKLN